MGLIAQLLPRSARRGIEAGFQYIGSFIQGFQWAIKSHNLDALEDLEAVAAQWLSEFTTAPGVLLPGLVNMLVEGKAVDIFEQSRRMFQQWEVKWGKH